MDRVHFSINGEHFSVQVMLSVPVFLHRYNCLMVNVRSDGLHNALHEYHGGLDPAFEEDEHRHHGSRVFRGHLANEFIRRHAERRGTKYMCLEGGCGSCVVNVRASQPPSREVVSFSVNSCLVSILSCDDWEITTVEGIGNRQEGYHIVQKRLDHFFGSQCGYCSPGFVMSMFSLLRSTDHPLSAAEIEESFGSNLCRCTGYRPILEAFKSFAVNPDPNLFKKIEDIEDLSKAFCPKSGKQCSGSCNDKTIVGDWYLIETKHIQDPNSTFKKISLIDGRVWYTVGEVRNIFETLDSEGYDSYMLVAGNTAKGARPIKFYPKVLVDISGVKELKTHYLDVNLVLGAGYTLTETINLFNELSKTNEDFWYLHVLANHLEKVAHIPVRNIGTLAGNLILKHEHPDFQSDVFLLLDCIDASITLVDRYLQETELNLTEFMQTSIVGKVMTKIKLPPFSKNYKIVTYKVAPREQNAHAQVNSAFLFHFDLKSHNIKTASIVYGGINPNFSHAYETENYLKGRDIFNNEVLQEALHCLETEVRPDYDPPEPEPYFRHKVAVGLFYKCVIKLCPGDILNPIYESGATLVDRPPVSHSYQEYDTKKKDYPLTQPLLKKEGIIQCAGEAVFSEDVPRNLNEVFAAFVLSKLPNGDVESVDGSEALNNDGVYAVYTSKDIPGVNSHVVIDNRFIRELEEFLATKVRYYNQPVAIVVANTQALADSSSYLVKVKYKDSIHKEPRVELKDAIHAPKEENRIRTFVPIIPTERGSNVKVIIKGIFYSPRQYHHPMELYSCVTVPVDSGFEVYSATQQPDLVEGAIAKLLNIPDNHVTVVTRRIGGGFGCKITRANIVACASALVSKLMNRSCRISMHLRDMMRAVGRRPDSILNYEVAVDENGGIQYLNGQFYLDNGISHNENENSLVQTSFPNCYNDSRWKLDNFGVLTDTPSNCVMRSPGGFMAIAASEHIMEHIAFSLNKDPFQVRMANYRKDDNDLPELLPQFLDKVEYYHRQESIKKFNTQNRWKKRGLAVNNMSFPSDYLGNYLALVGVYHSDGSVVINTGGVEIGQGIYTRLAQVAAQKFNIPVEMVSILPVYNFANPNNFATASSITTESCAYSVIKCCDQINARLAPFRAAMPDATWLELISAANDKGILLQANYLTSPYDPRLINYPIFGIAAVEVEIDVITGKHWIVRADVFEDVGKSINPALDVGQVEGAFVQGLSAWSMEDIIYNDHTGELYTDRTWNYQIFGAKDIPHDFRVYLRRKRPNPVGILGSKAVGEPPICLSHALVDALRNAVHASRHDSRYDDDHFVNFDVPVNNQNIIKAAEARTEEYILY